VAEATAMSAWEILQALIDHLRPISVIYVPGRHARVGGSRAAQESHLRQPGPDRRCVS
jgi:hypothetical protein